MCVDILTRCNTFSVESHLQSKRLRQLGHIFRMPDHTLPKKLFAWASQGLPPLQAALGCNVAAVRDCQLRCIPKYN